jgi:hypothetical protein
VYSPIAHAAVKAPSEYRLPWATLRMFITP